MKTWVLNRRDILAVLDRTGLRQHMVEALMRISLGEALNYPRQVIELGPGRSLGFMPAQDLILDLIGYKTVSVFSENKELGLNPHQGAVILLDSKTGQVRAILDGSTITAIRTAAVSAAATEKLSLPGSRILALIGAGRQAYEHALALSEVRKIKKIFVWNRSVEAAERLIAILRSELPCEIESAMTPESAVAEADVIVTCTASSKALLKVDHIRPGAHVNAIGACRSGQLEIQLSNREHLKIYMDSREACVREASEISEAVASKRLDSALIMGEIGDCFAGRILGRDQATDITFFKSVGLGIEDIFAAEFLYQRALRLNIGTTIDLRG